MALLAEAIGKRCVRTGHKLGNDVIAQQSVPSAIFSALLGQAPVEGFDQECEFSRVLQVICCFLALGFSGEVGAYIKGIK